MDPVSNSIASLERLLSILQALELFVNIDILSGDRI
jgi:hypothetical protein